MIACIRFWKFCIFSLAPKMFTLLFAAVKPLLTQATIDKFRIYGTDENEWKPALLEYIDADQLPVHYGGTMTDPDGDPKCSSRVDIVCRFLCCSDLTDFRRWTHSSTRAVLFQLHTTYLPLNLCLTRTCNLSQYTAVVKRSSNLKPLSRIQT